MKLSDFKYDLPNELIAQYPLSKRTQSRLMYIHKSSAEISHYQFTHLLNVLTENDLLIFNNTKVIPARMYGHKSTGGKIELLIERVINTHQAWAHIRSSKAPKINAKLIFNNTIQVTVIDRKEDLFLLEFSSEQSIIEILNELGEMPLPPYINRKAEKADEHRYQTVYAQHIGAVAAPTAGLHFDESIMQQLEQKGINQAYVTLHVGAGTFQPVRVDSILQHKMHHETISIDADVCQLIEQTKAKGGRVIAVGTTVVRVLEAAAQTGKIKPFVGDTDIFIYPGYKFKVIDGIITNFHLPESTLLMLVSAFAGCEFIRHAYQLAIEHKYRFFSYGDAMLIV